MSGIDLLTLTKLPIKCPYLIDFELSTDMSHESQCLVSHAQAVGTVQECVLVGKHVIHRTQ